MNKRRWNVIESDIIKTGVNEKNVCDLVKWMTRTRVADPKQL